MDDTEGTPEPGDSVETTRGALRSREQLQLDYDAAGSLRNLGKMYGIDYRRARRLLTDAGIEIRKRGSNGSHHTESWHAALRQRVEDGSLPAQLAKAREKRWRDPAQHERASQLLRGVWQSDTEWRSRHAATLRRMWDDPAKPLARHWDDPVQRERQRQLWLRRVSAARSRTGIPPGEAALHDALMRASISFTASAVVVDGLYIVDVLIHQQPVIIEADGASHNMRGAAQHDAERTAVLVTAGYKVIRLTYRELAEDADACVASLRLTSEAYPAYTIRSHSQAFGELMKERAKRR